MKATAWAVGASIFGVITGIILSYSYLEQKIEQRTKVEMRVSTLESNYVKLLSDNWIEKGENNKKIDKLDHDTEMIKEKLLIIEHSKAAQ